MRREASLGHFAHFMWMYIHTYTDKEKRKGRGGVGDRSVGKASQIQIPSIHTKARWAWQPTHNPTAQAVLEGSWLARWLGPASSEFRKETQPRRLRRRVAKEDAFGLHSWTHVCAQIHANTVLLGFFVGLTQPRVI